MEHIVESGKRLGREELDLSLLTDGLRAEREQGITIDVAYRYFATPPENLLLLIHPDISSIQGIWLQEPALQILQ